MLRTLQSIGTAHEELNDGSGREEVVSAHGKMRAVVRVIRVQKPLNRVGGEKMNGGSSFLRRNPVS
jgi:hypothetical protein